MKKSDAEVFFFWISKKGLNQAFLQFQSVSFKPHIECIYKYEIKDSVKIGDIEFSQSYWCFDLIETGEERPKSDIAVVQKMLNCNRVNTTSKICRTKICIPE